MKRLFLVLAIMVCAVSAFAQPPQATGKSAWKTFISKEGRFSVLLPSRPISSTQDPNTSEAVGSSHVFMLAVKDTAFYINYTDFKPEDIKKANTAKILDGARDGGVSNSKGKLLSEKKITLDGYPGREIAIDLPGEQKSIARARFYLADSRLYALIFAGPAPSATGADTDAFLASLKLIKSKPLPETWTSLDSTEGRFRLKMPGKPEPSVIQPNTKDAVHLWQIVSKTGDASYFAAYNDLPAQVDKIEDIENALDKGIEAVAKSLSATVVEQSLLSVDGNPGRDVRLRLGANNAADEGAGVLRVCIVKDRYYQVMALGSMVAMERGRIDEFLDSFNLIPPRPTTK